MGRIIKFFKEAIEEIKKVVWPSRQTLIKQTIIVIIAVVITMVIVGSIDFGLSELVKLMVTHSK
jgi:preprotein translocase subunit SecE